MSDACSDFIADTLTLSGDWRIGRLDAHRASLQAALAQAPASLQINASAISHIDTLGLQLLAVFVQQCSRAKLQVDWLLPAPVVQTAAERLGLGAILALPAAMPA